MKQWIKIGIAAVLVWFLIEHVDWSKVGEILLAVSVPFLLLYVLLQLLGNLISAKKWQYLGSLQGFHFSWKDGFFAYLAGAFINNFFPSTIGGDTYRTLWMKRLGDGWRAMTVVVYDRLSGLLALFLLASLGFFVIPSWSTWGSSPWLIILAAIVFSVTLIILAGVFYAYSLFETLLALSQWLPWESISNFIKRFRVFANGSVYVTALLYSLLFTCVGIALNNYTLFHALGADVSIFAFFGCIFLATLLASLPISINNIGIKEWAYVFFFGLIGISTEMAVTAALLSRMIQMILSLFALPWYFNQKKMPQT